MSVPGGVADELIGAFVETFERVRAMVRGPWPDASNGGTTTRNPKGDAQAWFDVEAHRITVEVLRDRLGSGVLLSEEAAEPIELGTGGPASGFTIVVDPVDGSTNTKHGMPISGFAIGAFDRREPLTPRSGVVSLVGPLQDGPAMVAVKDAGAQEWDGNGLGRRLEVARPVELRHAYVSIERSAVAADRDPHALLTASVGSPRSLGASTRSLAMVADGVFHAHVDARGTLTAENFLAPGHLILEAGGVILGTNGREIEAIDRLTDQRSIVAACSSEMADRVLATI